MRRSQHMATSNPPPKVRRVIFFHGIHRVDLEWGLSPDAAGIENPFAVKAFLEAEKGIQSTSSRAASWAPVSEDKSAPAKVG